MNAWYGLTIWDYAQLSHPINMMKERVSPQTLLVDSPALGPEAPIYNSEFQAPTLLPVPVLSVAIAGCDPVACSTLRHMLQQTGLVKDIREWASTESTELRHSQDVPDVVFLDLNSNGEHDFTFAQQVIRLRPSAHIVACSVKRESDPAFLLQAMRSGVRDFLQKPFERAELASIIARLSNEQQHHAPSRTVTGKLFVVLGTKGGVGTSTVAVNLAVQLAQMQGKSAVLLDFSRPMGDVAALLDLKPRFQLRDATENYKRLDPTLLSGLLTPHKSGLHVLCGVAHLEDWQHASVPAIERLIEIAQQSFDFVVMDCGSFYSEEWENILRAAEILLVSEADLPGLAKLHRHLGALVRLQVSSAQLRLIINRWHRHDEQALEKVENDMKTPVFARIPNNFKQVSQATVRGDSLAKEADELSSEFNRMATRLAGLEIAKQAKKSRLGQFFSF
jgi:pilus assembly protein CpaE